MRLRIVIYTFFLATLCIGCGGHGHIRQLERLEAQSLFPDTTVLYYQLCYQNLGRHYLNKKMPDEALEAYTAYHNVAEEYNHLYADIGLAKTYI